MLARLFPAVEDWQEDPIPNTADTIGITTVTIAGGYVGYMAGDQVVFIGADGRRQKRLVTKVSNTTITLKAPRTWTWWGIVKVALLAAAFGLLMIGCADPPAVEIREKTVPGPAAASVIIKQTEGRIWLWKRPNGSCYMSIDAPGWQTMFVDVSGGPCNEPGVPSVILKQQKPEGGQ